MRRDMHRTQQRTRVDEGIGEVVFRDAERDVAEVFGELGLPHHLPVLCCIG